MSTFLMSQFFPREGQPRKEGGCGMWEANVPGLGNVMVGVTDKGVALIMPEIALPTATECRALREEIQKLRGDLARQGKAGEL